MKNSGSIPTSIRAACHCPMTILFFRTGSAPAVNAL
jgi:hypothetical protein